jgi:multidrug efflux pump
MFTRFFIDRPIFATVLSVMITLAGGVAVFTLPIAQYPNITPPTVEVSAVYPGANAKIVADTVASPIEQQVNGVEDMMYMSSQSGNDGSYTLTVTVKPGADLNIAQVLVQNRVNLALPTLPDLVRRRGVTVKKKSPNVLMIVNLSSPDGSRDNLYLSNYATIQLRDELARLPGVGDIQYLGQRDYSMRIWLDPEKLASRNLSAADVVAAVQEQNIQVAAGQVGQPPAPSKQAFQYTIQTLGRLTDPDEFAAMILKTDESGRVVRLRDVCRIELGALAYDQGCTLDGKPSVALSVYQLPSSNALETASNVRAKMEELKSRFPSGLDYSVVYDTTPFIAESIREVFLTLRDAVFLVALVILVFLQSWRAALIPLAAVPVAIIGTFAAMAAADFSLNNLTLFGLVLAVGIVVDDAIVVVEAVQHHIERGLSPRDATIQAMSEVAGPVIAVGLVLAAVFVPCLFISGVVGEFFRQFAVTIAVSTLISAFNSLTLSPALCALLLKPHGEAERYPLPAVMIALIGGFLAATNFGPRLESIVANRLPMEQSANAPLVAWLLVGVAGFVVGLLLSGVVNRLIYLLFRGFNRLFGWITDGYLKAVSGVLRIGVIALVAYVGLLFGTWKTLDSAPAGFIPEQDKGYLIANLQLPDSASKARTDAAIAELEAIAKETPGVRHIVAIAGQSMTLGVNAPNYGSAYLMLDDFEDRHDAEHASARIAERLKRTLAERFPDAEVHLFGAPPIEGLGATGGFKLIIEDRGAAGTVDLEETTRQVVDEIRADDSFREVFAGFRAETPWLHLDIDRVEAKTRQVSMAEIINSLQVFFGSLYVNDFNLFGRTWQVNLQGDATFRQKIEDLKRLWVRNLEGRLVPMGSFVTVRDSVGPAMIHRYNLYASAAVTANPAHGVSSRQAIDRLERTTERNLSAGMKQEWTELALLELQTKDTATRAFVLAVVLVFLVLAAQYESWTLPLAVILVVPLCLLSAVVGVLWAGQDVNVFTQVGFVVLVGLACKNSILIVEFAKLRRDEGRDTREAVLEACRLRFRPIVMTSVAFILGVVPLLVSEGAGAEMRRLLGTAVFAGMIGVTVFGLFLTPVFFWAIDKVFGRARSRSQSVESFVRENHADITSR